MRLRTPNDKSEAAFRRLHLVSQLLQAYSADADFEAAFFFGWFGSP